MAYVKKKKTSLIILNISLCHFCKNKHIMMTVPCFTVSCLTIYTIIESNMCYLCFIFRYFFTSH